MTEAAEESTLRARAQAQLAGIAEAREVVGDIAALLNVVLTVGINQYNTELVDAQRRQIRYTAAVAKDVLTQPGRSRALRQTVERGLVLGQQEAINAIYGLFEPVERFREDARARRGDEVAGAIAGEVGAQPQEVAEALGYVWDVVHGGPEVWAALGSAQVQKALDACRAQQRNVQALITGLERVLRDVRRPRYDPLWARAIRQREQALFFLRLARANAERTQRIVEEQNGFDARRYRHALDQLSAAQAVLTASPEGEAAQAWLTQFMANTQDLGFFEAVYNETRAPDRETIEQARTQWEAATEALGEDDDLDAADGSLRATLGRTEQAVATAGEAFDDGGALQFLSGLSEAADLKRHLARVGDHHTTLYRRLAALRRMRGEMEQARQDLGPIATDLASMIETIDALEQDMKGTQNRLALVSAAPGWVARLAVLRASMDAALGDEVQEALGAGHTQALFGTQLLGLIDFLDNAAQVSLFRGPTPPASTGRDGVGAAILHHLDLLLSARSQDTDAAEGLEQRVQGWLAELSALRQQLGHLSLALARVPRTEHAAVDRLDEYIASYSPNLDGLAWAIDSGRWSWAMRVNADLAGQAGMLSYRIRQTLLGGAARVPKVGELTRSLIDWLNLQRRALLAEIGAEESHLNSHTVALERQRAELERVQSWVDALAEALTEEERQQMDLLSQFTEAGV